MNTQPNTQQSNEQSRQTDTILKTRFILIFIFGFALGALTIIAWDNAPQQIKNSGVSTTSGISTTTSAKNKTATSTEKVPALFSTGVGTGRVTVTNQSAGDSVLVESVTVPPPGVWVAVRETYGKRLGNILGAAYVRGPRSNLSVGLSRNTQPNRLYVIELYRPGPKEGVFNVKTESVYVDLGTGRGVIVPFQTNSTTRTGTADTK